MTQEDASEEPVEVNRDVDCMIYGGRYGKMAGSPTSQFYATIAFDAIGYARLASLLGANLKGRVVLHIVNIQAPLPDEDPDEAEQTDQGKLFRGDGSAGLAGIVVEGAAFLPHVFTPAKGNEDMCDVCQTHRICAIHIGQGVDTESSPEERAQLFAARPYNHVYIENEDDATCRVCGSLELDVSHMTEEAIIRKARLAARQRRG